MAGMPHHHISQVASRAMDRWRFLAFEALAWSRVRAKPTNLDAVENFTAAYRRSATELARVRAFSPDKRLADFIEHGVANAHFAVYRRNRPKFRDIVEGAIFAVPEAVRSLWKYHLLSFCLFFGSGLVAYIAVMYAPDTFYIFIDREFAGGRDPYASREFLAQTLGPQETSLDQDVNFSSMLFVNNTRVSFMCFAWGAILGVPTIYLLVKNGLMLGAFIAVFFRAGLGVETIAWLGPHGVPELGAIVLAGGAGMAIGHTVLNPGKRSRQDALTDVAKRACIVALGCIPMLATAGLIEGIFRQSYASIGLRYGLMILMMVIFGGWLFFVRRPRAKTAMAVA